MIDLEKRVREESHNSLIRLIEDTQKKLAREVILE